MRLLFLFIVVVVGFVASCNDPHVQPNNSALVRVCVAYNRPGTLDGRHYGAGHVVDSSFVVERPSKVEIRFTGGSYHPFVSVDESKSNLPQLAEGGITYIIFIQKQ